MILSKSMLRKIVKEEITAALESMSLEWRSDADLITAAEDGGYEELIVYDEPGSLDDKSRENIIAALANDA
jgi:hypothetical protein